MAKKNIGSAIPEKRKRSILLSSPGFWIKIFVAVQMVLLAAEFSPDISTNGDDAKYLILGKSLVSGSGYHCIYEPTNPIEAQYPPLFPAFLGFFSLFGSELLIPKIAVGIISGCMLLLLFYYLRSTFWRFALPVTLVTALSSSVASHSTVLLSEVPYLFASLGALMLLELYRRRGGMGVIFWVAAITAIAPAFIRTVGISFVAAWVISNILDKKYKQAAAHLLIFIAATVLLRLTSSWNSPYIDELFRKNTYNPELGFVTIPEMIGRIGANLHMYLFEVLPQAMLGRFPSGNAFLVLSFGLMLLTGIGWIRNFALPTRFLSFYLLFYGGIICMWQTQWTSLRFIVPILPFLIILVLLGLETVSRFVLRIFSKGKESEFLKTGIIWSLAALLAFLNGCGQLRLLNENNALTADWINFYRCADWVRVNTPKDAIVVSRKPEPFYLRAHRRGFVYPFSTNPEEVIDGLNKGEAQYCILDNFFWTGTTMHYLVPAIRKHPEMFRIVYSLTDPETYVLEIRK
jgi:hypothetical protein